MPNKTIKSNDIGKGITLSDNNFKYFKERVKFYLNKLELDNYWNVKITRKEKSDGCLNGYCESEYWNGIAEICLITSGYIINKEILEEDLDETARHEVCHLILGKLQSLARDRFVTSREMTDAIEETNRKLTRLFGLYIK